jgi:predicted metal-dependent HD superfamily phosphohydrolase
MNNLVEISGEVVSGLFDSVGTQTLLYHNVIHTREVVEAVKLMSSHYQLSEDDNQALTVAAWWHDVGYLSGTPENHEMRSVERVKSFLKKYNVSPEFVSKVEGCIMATKMPQRPTNLIERIICDADLFHFGKPDFMDDTRMLRKEVEKISGNPIKGSEWRNATIRLLESHEYFTEYARETLSGTKKQNLEALYKKNEEKKQEKLKEKELAAASSDLQFKKDELKAEKADAKFNKPKRGIETMFRLTSRNHMDLSGMADSKANIMISVNSIIISIVLSVLLRRLEDMPYYTIPTLIMLAVNVSTIIFAVLATRPNTTKGTFTREDIKQKKVNLLFFGNFHKVGLVDFDWGMKEMMNDKEYLYTSIAKDIYFLGVVLGKKYKLLRISYNIFMYGLVISIIAFILAFALSPE